ncbi:MAG: glutamate racemase [Clostridia bacterium]|nr:glutamate racemase [Clostridia bacterium]
MGGISVLKEAKKMLPFESFVFFGDGKNIPYGTKSINELIKLSDDICTMLIEEYDVKAIVIACNTATSAAVSYLRKKYEIPIIGMEPALKPAVKDHYGGTVGVLATEVTLREEKFQKLSALYNVSTTVLELPAPNLVYLVERGIVDGDEALKEIQVALRGEASRLDALVLGCTHFVFLREAINTFFEGKLAIYDGNLGTINNLKRILEAQALLASGPEGFVKILNSGGDHLVEQSWKLYRL